MLFFFQVKATTESLLIVIQVHMEKLWPYEMQGKTWEHLNWQAVVCTQTLNHALCVLLQFGGASKQILDSFDFKGALALADIGISTVLGMCCTVLLEWQAIMKNAAGRGEVRLREKLDRGLSL